MSWLLLFTAGLFEVAWAVGMKYSCGFTRLWPSVFTAVTMAASVGCLALAMRNLPLGTAYAIWTGIGTVGTVIAGVVFFGESVQFWRILCVFCIIAGIIGLKLLTR
ncbi:MAG: quaternary ammonium compound efflux SMR transporter SugE [Lentisphaeria bacterium]|nr:quaternary ammonium compound efflux SMR transporter SugE [Lentisphaeria bacterium]